MFALDAAPGRDAVDAEVTGLEFQESLDGPALFAAVCESSTANSSATSLSAATDLGLTSLLSASYYHAAPEPLRRRGQRSSDSQATLPLYGGLELALNSYLDQDKPAAEDKPEFKGAGAGAQKGRKRQHDGSEVTATAKPKPKKPGRPPKTAESLEGEDPEERRRRQLRVAQRAYRSRKETYVSSLTDRITQLESAVDKMSATIISFSDELVRSGVLAPHAALTASLRETIQTCLLLATASSNEGDDADEQPSTTTTVGPRLQEQAPSPEQANGSPAPPLTVDFSVLNDPCPPGPLQSRAAPVMEYSAFMDRLHMAIVYHGYLALADPSTSLKRLRRHFRLLFTIMDRGRMTSYFAAALHAKVSKTRLGKEWNEVPFFHLGGAGSHYDWSATEAPSSAALYPRKSAHWRTVLVPLSLFSADLQEELGGDWFDMQDLECYLRKKNVHLLVLPESTLEAKSESPNWVNVSSFIPALLNKSTCLGRTPGFRRRDVDTALRTAACR